MMAPGFDTVLKRDWQEKWVMIPRRQRLDAENWCLQTQVDKRPPIDYEYIIFSQLLTNREGIHGFKWDERTLARWDIPIDDIITFQGSCWFMSKDWFKERGYMDLKYQGWGQEAEEISFETWKNGGRVVVDKNTWYAHLHKGDKYGRMYWMSRDENRKSYQYSYNRWIIENKDFFISLIKKFEPLPSWPENWRERIWTQDKQ
jgi:GT2 family glycosyltransferase